MLQSSNHRAEDSVVQDNQVEAAPWGTQLPADIAEVIRACVDVSIEYLHAPSGTDFGQPSAVAGRPDVVDASKLRFPMDAAGFRGVGGHPFKVDAVVRCEVSNEIGLKLWGHLTIENPEKAEERFGAVDRTGSEATIPAIFSVLLWERSHAKQPRIDQLLRESAEKDRTIRELQLAVALSMCSQ